MDFKIFFLLFAFMATSEAWWFKVGGRGHETSNSNDWPSFSTMWSNYPRYNGYSSHQLIQKCKLRSWLDVPGLNTCAIRVSNSLISSGKNLNDLTGCNWSGTTNTDGDMYIIRVNTMNCYLVQQGKSYIEGDSEQDFRSHNGVIVFRSCSFSDATGHVDLWNGYSCAGNCYFHECSDIRLFEW